MPTAPLCHTLWQRARQLINALSTSCLVFFNDSTYFVCNSSWLQDFRVTAGIELRIIKIDVRLAFASLTRIQIDWNTILRSVRIFAFVFARTQNQRKFSPIPRTQKWERENQTKWTQRNWKGGFLCINYRPTRRLSTIGWEKLKYLKQCQSKWMQRISIYGKRFMCSRITFLNWIIIIVLIDPKWLRKCIRSTSTRQT